MNKKLIAIAIGGLLVSQVVHGADDAVDVSRTSRVYLKPTCDMTGGSATAVKTQGLMAGVLAAILPNLVSGGVDMVGKALAAQAASKTKTVTTGGTEYVLEAETSGEVKPSANFYCVHVMFDDPEVGEIRKNRGWGREEELTEQEKKFLEALKLKQSVKGLPLFYFEGKIDLSADKRFFRVVPALFYYKKAMVKSGWGGTDNRSIALTLSFSKPGAEPYASTVLKLNEVSEKAYLVAHELPQDTEWVPMLAADDEEKKFAAERKGKQDTFAAVTKEAQEKKDALTAVQKQLGDPIPAIDPRQTKLVDEFCKTLAKIKKDKEHEQCPLATFEGQERARRILERLDVLKEEQRAADAITAVSKKLADATAAKAKLDGEASVQLGLSNIKFGLSETREASKFYEFLSGVFESSKEGITTALKDNLIKANRVAAQKTATENEIKEQNDKDSNYIALLQAQTAVAEAEETLAGLQSDATAPQKRKAQDALRVAKIQANQAARKAGVSIPYPEASVF